MGGRGRDGEWWRGESGVEEEEEEEGGVGGSKSPSEWEEGWEGGEWRAGVDTQPIGYAPPAHTHSHCRPKLSKPRARVGPWRHMLLG